MTDHTNDVPMPYWSKLFVQVGFPTALAILLVAALLGWMPSPIMQTLSRLEYIAWQQASLMRAMCNAQVPSEQRYKCEPWKAQEN